MGSFNREKNRVVWVDIPVSDLDRAAKFYCQVLGAEVILEEFNGVRFGVIDHEDGNGGCLVVSPSTISSTQGPLIYLNVYGRIHEAVQLVTDSGGTIVEEVQTMGPHGMRAIVIDSEGNRVALHSDSV